MSSYTAWAPQEFNEAALDVSIAADATAVDPPAQPGNGESTEPDSEFQYDSTSGKCSLVCIYTPQHSIHITCSSFFSAVVQSLLFGLKYLSRVLDVLPAQEISYCPHLGISDEAIMEKHAKCLPQNLKGDATKLQGFFLACRLLLSCTLWILL